ncbi:MAG: minor capsid protein [Actinobacteria bacterium]|nr:minor capsid protein [Actinomycetota bacterium]
MISVAVARFLDNLGVLIYDEAGIEGYCFTGPLPPEPDLAISIRQYGGTGDFQHGYDTPRVQVLVRAATNDEALTKATEIYTVLHALRYTTLDSGGDAEAYMVFCKALDLPSDIGIDENGRHQFTTNYEIEHTVVSTNRE